MDSFFIVLNPQTGQNPAVSLARLESRSSFSARDESVCHVAQHGDASDAHDLERSVGSETALWGSES